MGNFEGMNESRDGLRVAWIFSLKGGTVVLIGGWMNVFMCGIDVIIIVRWKH